MLAWEEWSRPAFERASAENKPVLLWLPCLSSLSQAEWERLFAVAEAPAQGFVRLRVEKAERPDVHRRYAAAGSSLLALSGAGDILRPLEEGTALAGSLQALLKDYQPPAARAAQVPGPAWTGAMGEQTRKPLDAGRPQAALAAVLAETRLLAGLPGALELLLYASREWKDARARERLGRELSRLEGESRDPGSGAFLDRGQEPLGWNAVLARLYWDAYALTREEALRATARAVSEFLLDRLYDPEAGAFRSLARGPARFYADANAQAATALQRAAVFEDNPRFGEAAARVLSFLEARLYDPLLGLIHRRDEGGLIYGLLADNAWGILAFTEAFLVTGRKSYREFADGLLRFLFQELWERERGGFLDRVPQKDELGLLKENRLSLDDNAAAFEGLWRLHHLSGRAHYRRWLEWGLASLGPSGEATPAEAGLARAQDMLKRGRMELELVGRLEDEKTRRLLAALNRQYAPRKVVSFIDPDDQDYIQAHKLEAASLPRLFGCVGLRRKADTDDPAGVASVLEAL